MRNISHAVSIDGHDSLVRHRMNFISKLATKHEDETDELINIDGIWHPFPGKDFQGLKAYLLLTCFDLLGQSNANARNLSAVVHDSDRNGDLRASFYKFINTMVDPLRRKELLNSVIIVKKDKQTDIPVPCIITSADKLQVLFDIRCSYMNDEIAVTDSLNEEQLSETPASRQYVHLLWKPALFINTIKEIIGD